MKCQRTVKRVPCSKQATMYVLALGGKNWDGYYCTKHATRIIEVRMRLIQKYKQNVVLRRITKWDRKRWKEGRK